MENTEIFLSRGSLNWVLRRQGRSLSPEESSKCSWGTTPDLKSRFSSYDRFQFFDTFSCSRLPRNWITYHDLIVICRACPNWGMQVRGISIDSPKPRII